MEGHVLEADCGQYMALPDKYLKHREIIKTAVNGEIEASVLLFGTKA
jgi:hypothetical protein